MSTGSSKSGVVIRMTFLNCLNIKMLFKQCSYVTNTLRTCNFLRPFKVIFEGLSHQSQSKMDTCMYCSNWIYVHTWSKTAARMQSSPSHQTGLFVFGCSETPANTGQAFVTIWGVGPLPFISTKSQEKYSLGLTRASSQNLR